MPSFDSQFPVMAVRRAEPVLTVIVAGINFQGVGRVGHIGSRRLLKKFRRSVPDSTQLPRLNPAWTS